MISNKYRVFIREMKHQEEFRDYGLEPMNRILMYGGFRNRQDIQHIRKNTEYKFDSNTLVNITDLNLGKFINKAREHQSLDLHGNKFRNKLLDDIMISQGSKCCRCGYKIALDK